MKKRSYFLSIAMASLLAVSFTGCGSDDDSSNDTTNTTNTTSTTKQTLSGDITTDTTLTKDKVWVLEGLVAVKNNAILTIEEGTTILGKDGTGDATSYLVIDKGSKIMAEGTAAEPIIFTSETAYDGGTAAVGQWGGVTIIGNAANSQVNPYEVNEDFVAGDTNLADNSGVLKYVEIRNSGITMEQDKEINGLSFVGVGSGTTVENITVDLSDDDGIEIWGGSVNLSNITITRCTDDYFDIDDGYNGTVTNLNITTTTGNAGIEMSGTTEATFDGLNITYGSTGAKEGSIYFKGANIGGHFSDVNISHNATNGYGVFYNDNVTTDLTTISFTNVAVTNNGTDNEFVGKAATTTSITDIEAVFTNGTGNSIAQ